MPSSSAATPTTVPEWEAPPAVGRPQQTTARLTMSGTLQYSSSFSGSELFPAKAARTTSSTLDDLQLDITLWNKERISEFPSLSGITLPHSGTTATHRRIRWKGRRRGSGLRGRIRDGVRTPLPLPI